MQQVRAEVRNASLDLYEYQFEREIQGWDPEFSLDHEVHPSRAIGDAVALMEAQGDPKSPRAWKLVKGLIATAGFGQGKG